MKAVVESGATVQLTTQDLSDTDMEDDENVYNIKVIFHFKKIYRRHFHTQPFNYN